MTTIARWRLVGMSLLFLGALMLLPGTSLADDVPENCRKKYDQAKELYAKGGEKNLKKAMSNLNKLRDKAATSVDFWEFYVRLGRLTGKKEESIWRSVGKREAANPTSPSFDLLRARFETDLEKQREFYDKALAKTPDALPIKLLIAENLIGQEEEVDAEEIVDAILETQPTNPRALVLKGEIQIIGGYAQTAIDFAEEQLGANNLPGLHDLRARALLQLIEDGEAKDDALQEAGKSADAAVKGRAEPAFVLTKARILNMQSEQDKAAKLLKEHFEKTGSPLLAGMLGELAFRTGDYKTAVKVLGANAKTDLVAAKAVAMSHARLGNKKDAGAALATVLSLDANQKAFAAWVHSRLGDFAQAKTAAAGLEKGAGWRAYLAANTGDAATVLKEAGDSLKDGGPSAETFMLFYLQGQLMMKLGAKAGAVRGQFIKGRHAAAKKGIPGAKVPDFQVPRKANSIGFMARVVTYTKSICGNNFRPAGRWTPIVPTQVGGKQALGSGFIGTADCNEDPQRAFAFNAQVIEGGGSITISQPNGDFDAAVTGLKEAGTALAAGDYKKAVEGFDKALAVEAEWHRVKVMREVSRALASESDLADAAMPAGEAALKEPDDFLSRRLAWLLQLWAGEDVSGKLKAFLDAVEQYSERRMTKL